MSDDEDRITWESVSLSIGGVVWSASPAGSFDVWPDDQRLFLAEVLMDAMQRHGLEARGRDVFRTMEEIARPHFAKAIVAIEESRRLIAGEHG